MEPRSSGCWKRCFPFECSSGIIIIILYRQRHYLLRNFWSLLPILSFLHGTGLVISTMSTKMKGIYKSLKFITQIFVVKEREMEIGYPTDVKHVAHIGWDGPSGNGPSWMNEFKTAPDFSTSLGNLGERRDPNPLSTTIMPTRDFAETSQTTSNMFEDIPSQEIPCVPKKQKRKKIKSISPKSSSSTARHLRAAKSTPAFNEREATAIVQV